MDARGKFFINCAGCGRFMYNTRLGQERLLARVQAEPEIIDDAPVPEPEPTPEVTPSKKNGGLVVMGIGLLLGLISWTQSKKPKPPNRPMM